jgi:hypothetical protein
VGTHTGLAIELGITRKKSLSPQMEAILIWCQCRTRSYSNVQVWLGLVLTGFDWIEQVVDFTKSWANGLAFCALIHNFFPNAFDFNALRCDTPKVLTNQMSSFLQIRFVFLRTG